MHHHTDPHGRRVTVSNLIHGLGPGAFATCVVLYTYVAYALAAAAMAPINFQMGEAMYRWAVIASPIPAITTVGYFGGLIFLWLRRRRVSRDR